MDFCGGWTSSGGRRNGKPVAQFSSLEELTGNRFDLIVFLWR
jgi:hypothetical protein